MITNLCRSDRGEAGVQRTLRGGDDRRIFSTKSMNRALLVDLYADCAHNELMATKSARFAMRLTPEQDALIRRAAEAEGTDLTTFTVCASVARARDVLADRRLFLLDDARWADFTALLERPVQHKAALQELLAKPPLFDQ